MVSKTSARNQSQTAGKVFRVEGRVIVASVGIYICPVNKEARVTDMQMRLDAVGSDLLYFIAIKTGAVYKKISQRTFVETDPTTNNDIEEVRRVTASQVTLKAGDILTDIGDAGATNGTVDMSATIEEFSV